MTEYAGVLAGSELASLLKKEAAADYQVVLGAVKVPYLTRLRTRMLVDHIDEDVELVPAAEAGDVPRTITAGDSVNAECAAPAMSVAGPAPPAAGILCALALAFMARPGSRRRRARR